MKLRKKDTTGSGTVRANVPSAPSLFGDAIDRRTFLQRSGLALGGTAVAGMLPLSMMKKVRAAQDISPQAGVEVEVRRSICTHCSVGCGVIAEVQDGVWTGQEPDFESPFNLGAHCAKGASVREHGHGEKRVNIP